MDCYLGKKKSFTRRDEKPIPLMYKRNFLLPKTFLEAWA